MARLYVVAVIGYVDMDLTMITPRVPDAGESLQAKSYSTSPGGKGANSAVAAFRSVHHKIDDNENNARFENAYGDIDIQVRMVGRVGNDGYGTAAIENLKANGVDVTGVQRVENDLTGICFCIVDAKSGENRLLFTLGATSTLTKADFTTPESLGAGVRPDMVISQLEVRIDAVEHMLKVAYDAGIDVLLNAAPASVILDETYQYLTHLIVNETEAATLAGGIDVEDVNKDTWAQIAQELLELGAQNVVITLGAQGAYYANKDGAKHVPAEKVNVVDSTGAG